MRQFKCPNCHETFSTRKWNARTSKGFGENILKIQDVGVTSLYYYTCPGCNTESDRDKIIEVVTIKRGD